MKPNSKKGAVAIRSEEVDCGPATYIDRQLSDARADGLLQDISSATASPGALPLSQWFNELVYPLFVQACFADPAYGENRNKVSWKAIGFPGSPGLAVGRRPASIRAQPADAPRANMKLPMFIAVGGLAATLSTSGLAAANKAPDAYAACAACHAPAGGHGIGPNLVGVVGRQAGTLSGFHYSRAMRQSGIKWNAKSLDRYIANPQGEIPGNRMPFAGIQDPEQRAAVVRYLSTLR
jgi:cytochrome c